MEQHDLSSKKRSSDQVGAVTTSSGLQFGPCVERNYSFSFSFLFYLLIPFLLDFLQALFLCALPRRCPPLAATFVPRLRVGFNVNEEHRICARLGQGTAWHSRSRRLWVEEGGKKKVGMCRAESVLFLVVLDGLRALLRCHASVSKLSSCTRLLRYRSYQISGFTSHSVIHLSSPHHLAPSALSTRKLQPSNDPFP